MSQSFWIIPFKERSSSGPQKVNFLWKQNNLYLMDNHRLALWCWSEALKDNLDQWNLFHLDAHYDCDPVAVSVWQAAGKKLSDLTIDEYLDYKTAEGKTLFLWDNYLPVFLDQYKERIGKKIAATHEMGLKGNFDLELDVYNLLKPLDDLFLYHKPWIVNLDFDYFYGRHDKTTPLFHPDFIRKFFSLIKLNYDCGHIKVITACLSPECCGGWEQAESILNIFTEVFELDFKLK